MNPPHPSVAIVGAGLAGLAAAVALAERGAAVELFEARRRLGGRTSSFDDQQTGTTVDLCQHISMGCCTNLADFARRVGIAQSFRRYRHLVFIDLRGKRYNFAASPLLPAPLHLAPGLMKLTFLSLAERISIARAMVRLARTQTSAGSAEPTVAQWLRSQGQSRRAIDLFWSVVLVSSLGETLDRAGLHYARKVFVDVFLANRAGHVFEVPTEPLEDLYGARLHRWLQARGVALHLSTAVTALSESQGAITGIRLRDGTSRPFDAVIIAAPWRKAAELLRSVPAGERLARQIGQIGSSPISGVHLWFDRAITSLPHAVLLGRHSQWLFNRGHDHAQAASDQYYYQVVISASRELPGGNPPEIVSAIVAELATAFPAAREAKLLHSRVVTDPEAVFSPVPEVDRWRPAQATTIGNLFLAGDWTATAWPATMEGAVRSGYLAAEAILKSIGRCEPVVVGDLPRSLIARLLVRGR